MTPPTTALSLFAIVALAAGAMGLSLHRRARSRARLWEHDKPDAERHTLGRTGRWLMLAGFGRRDATSRFATFCVAGFCAATAMAWLLAGSSPLHTLAWETSAIPVVGPPIARLVLALPWLAALVLSAAPILLVRARRDRRVAAVEQDLPMVLELLATLAEGGLGFDASLDRVVESQPAGRPLIDALRLFRLEVRGGGARIECLRRLAWRLEVPAVSSAVAALIQAEELGSGLAEVLRPLAEDLRLRRRERALAKAETLPEKLVFPLVLGFLPGLLVWTLGPSLHQLVTTIDTIMRGGQ